MMTRPHVIVALALLLLPALALAAPADSTTAASGRPNSLEPGAWALQFSTSDFHFSDAGVFLKHHGRANRAFRFGLELSLSSRSSDTTADTLGTSVGSSTNSRDQFNAHVELVVQRYANPLASAHFFYGVGPFFEYSKFQDETEEAFLGEERETLLDDRAYRVGAVVLFGVEWFASRSFSLDIEYIVNGGYESATSERTSDFEGPAPPFHTKEESSQWFVRGGDVRFALGIYF